MSKTLRPSITTEDIDPSNTLISDPLRIGISTRALFDLEEEHRIFKTEGVKAYANMQLERENTILGKGTGF
jgi:5'-nucleotidase